MTRNLYLGTGLDNVVGAPDPTSLIGAVTTDWVHVLQTNYPARAQALADEIQAARPDLIGLQEVSIWRDDAYNGIENPPDAANVQLEFLSLLQAALTSRGLNYSVASTSTNADVEAPRLTNFANLGGGLTDVRLTDRDVILRNDDNGLLSLSNPQNGHYATQLNIPTITGIVQFTRGWTSVDATIEGAPFRFVNTHLEVEGGPAGLVQAAQGNELLAGPLNTPLQTILVCDCNSATDGSNTPTYANLIAGGMQDAWTAVNSSTGNSCCQNELLSNSASQLHERIDLVLMRGGVKSKSATLLGATPFRTSPAPLWASDHAGVAAELKVMKP
jgi:endonuclease/exonuclease/phosphatase family metal-dependent hydrolase